jgi:hypothetical protein
VRARLPLFASEKRQQPVFGALPKSLTTKKKKKTKLNSINALVFAFFPALLLLARRAFDASDDASVTPLLRDRRFAEDKRRADFEEG